MVQLYEGEKPRGGRVRGRHSLARLEEHPDEAIFRSRHRALSGAEAGDNSAQVGGEGGGGGARGGQERGGGQRRRGETGELDRGAGGAVHAHFVLWHLKSNLNKFIELYRTVSSLRNLQQLNHLKFIIPDHCLNLPPRPQS